MFIEWTVNTCAFFFLKKPRFIQSLLKSYEYLGDYFIWYARILFEIFYTIIKCAHILLLFYLPKEWVKRFGSLQTNPEKMCLLHYGSHFGVEHVYLNWPWISPLGIYQYWYPTGKIMGSSKIDMTFPIGYTMVLISCYYKSGYIYHKEFIYFLYGLNESLVILWLL